jgi:hypothetical protein
MTHRHFTLRQFEWPGLERGETELFAQTCKSYERATVRYQVL